MYLYCCNGVIWTVGLLVRIRNLTLRIRKIKYVYLLHEEFSLEYKHSKINLVVASLLIVFVIIEMIWLISETSVGIRQFAHHNLSYSFCFPNSKAISYTKHLRFISNFKITSYATFFAFLVACCSVSVSSIVSVFCDIVLNICQFEYYFGLHLSVDTKQFIVDAEVVNFLQGAKSVAKLVAIVGINVALFILFSLNFIFGYSHTLKPKSVLCLSICGARTTSTAINHTIALVSFSNSSSLLIYLELLVNQPTTSYYIHTTQCILLNGEIDTRACTCTP